jgi:hypothetical protein
MLLLSSGTEQAEDDMPVRPSEMGVGGVVAAEPAVLIARAPPPTTAATAAAAAMRRNLMLVELLPRPHRLMAELGDSFTMHIIAARDGGSIPTGHNERAPIRSPIILNLAR